MVSLEEVLKAPLLPGNLPKFEIIKECEKVEEDHSSNSEDDSESESEIEEVFPCDCGFDEYSSNLDGQACGATANCINRELFIECNADECPCRERCQNRRFQKRQYAKVKVIETPGKGFGLFTCEDLKPGTLVMEYVGEIVTQEQMNERARKYSAQGQPHFYFMTLRPNQIIDATCKGNFSRFLNHSCSPNCETQKWIVKGKIKIGLFALKSVKAGTELTFDYKFVRFGKEPQKCLCGESNCTGFIGVSSENEKQGSKRRQRAVEIEDVDEFEVFMESDPKTAELPSEISIIVTKLIQTDDVEIVKKLLKFLESSEKYLCKRKFLNLHGLKLLATLFTEHLKDSEIVWSILKILKGLPLGTRNLIEDSGWVDKLKMVKNYPEFEVIVGELEKQWDQLEMAFKIPKKSELKERSSGQSTPNRSTSTSVLMSVPSEFSSALKRKRQWSLEKDEDEKIEKGRNSNSNREIRDLSSSPRPHERKSRSHESKSHSRESQSISRSRSPVKRVPDPMWLSATAPDGKIYYYHAVTRETSWELPMIEAKEAREHESDRDQDEYRRRDDYRTTRDYNRDNRDNRDGRYRDYKKDSRDYRDHRDRDTQSNRDTQSSYRESQSHRDTQSYRESQPRSTHSSHTSNTEESKNSALLEGVGDSSQLAAIIERAKARRSQIEEGEVDSILTGFNSQTIEDDASSPTDPKSSNNQSKKYYAKLKEEISSVVIKFFSHYRQELGNDFKELARKYTHKIIDKEDSGDSNDPVLTSKKKQKIKIYLAEVIKGRKIKLLPEHEYN